MQKCSLPPRGCPRSPQAAPAGGAPPSIAIGNHTGDSGAGTDGRAGLGNQTGDGDAFTVFSAGGGAGSAGGVFTASAPDGWSTTGGAPAGSASAAPAPVAAATGSEAAAAGAAAAGAESPAGTAAAGTGSATAAAGSATAAAGLTTDEVACPAEGAAEMDGDAWQTVRRLAPVAGPSSGIRWSRTF